jgi:hypothetical protein
MNDTDTRMAQQSPSEREILRAFRETAESVDRLAKRIARIRAKLAEIKEREGESMWP